MSSTIILISHGEMAKGVASSAQMITGTVESLYYFGLYPGEHPSEIMDGIIQILEQEPNEQLIIIGDLFGGSVCNAATELKKQYETIHLIYGMNLPLVIEVILNKDNITEDILKHCIENSRKGLRVFEDVKSGNEDPFF
ncbi:PTS sugar transporter subunit IIA [Rossellomorea marisflavi]|uniref:PTS sugar transporter subunit IIA n=1 Tax=Rossellomorea marisflavi TaxID=189381 RepID=UPI003515D202